MLDIDNNDIELPQEIPELPARQELINELRTMADKYGIIPPQGSIKLRSQLSRSIDCDLDSSYEHDSDYESPFSTNSPNTTMGTWPRNKRRMSHSACQNGNSSENSKNLQRKTSLAVSSPMQTRHKFITSNWAGESTPQIHRDPAECLPTNLRPEIGLETSPSTPPTIVNPRLAAMVALAEKAGLNTSDILKGKIKKSPDNMSLSASLITTKDDVFVMGNRAMTVTRQQQHDNEFNIIVREIFVNCFTHMLVDYEHFVILPHQTKEDWLNNREHMQNFDKASFLSDQSQFNLPFITLFVETQGFASLIDMKIMALWEDCDPRLAYFDKRIDKLKVKLGIIRSPIFEKCTSIMSAGDILFLITGCLGKGTPLEFN